jgi:hypothetical protein
VLGHESFKINQNINEMYSVVTSNDDIVNTDMRRLTTAIRSEKCVIRQFSRCAYVIQCTYTNLDSIAYYTPRLYDIAQRFSNCGTRTTSGPRVLPLRSS